jgi:hypothetical protein
LQSNPLIHVTDPDGLFTSDELTRVHDAVHAVVEPCGVCVPDGEGVPYYGSFSGGHAAKQGKRPRPPTPLLHERALTDDVTKKLLERV